MVVLGDGAAMGLAYPCRQDGGVSNHLLWSSCDRQAERTMLANSLKNPEHCSDPLPVVIDLKDTPEY